MDKRFKIAVVGATGAVGRELLSVLEQRNFPAHEVVAFASARSQGKPVRFREREYACQVLKPECFAGVDFAFFDASDAVSKEWVPEAARSGAWVIDNSSTFRMEQDIPLGVPEVNGDAIDAQIKAARVDGADHRRRIFAGPNCSTVQMVVALKPLRDRYGLKRVVVSTYQSVSGAGAAAMEELSNQAAAWLGQRAYPPKAFAHPIAFNCIPHIGGFKEDGYTSEEQKMIAESRKILEMPALKITATAVRVPTFSCHAESVNVQCERPFTLNEVREALRAQEGVVLEDEPKRNVYPLNRAEIGGSVQGGTGRDAVYVGRLRVDESAPNSLHLWIVSDNLRKGAALNAVQIGERLLKQLY